MNPQAQQNAGKPQQQVPNKKPVITREMIEAEQKAEEDLMRQAMEASLKEEQEKKQLLDLEEEELMKRVIEMSEREEKERLAKQKQDDEIQAKKTAEASA